MKQKNLTKKLKLNKTTIADIMEIHAGAADTLVRINQSANQTNCPLCPYTKYPTCSPSWCSGLYCC